MNLGMVGMAAKRISQVVIKNSPAILTACAAGGVIFTAIATAEAVVESRDTINAHDMDEELKCTVIDQRDRGDGTYDEHVHVYFRERTFAEKAKLTWRIWIKPVFIGGTTIGCIFGANHINTKRNLALAAAYSMSEEAAKEFRDKVAETMGERKVEKVENAIAQDKVNNNPQPDEDYICNTVYGDQLMYDEWSGRYFRSSKVDVEKKVLMLNKRMITKACNASMNDLYELIGIPTVPMGESFGWEYHYYDENEDIPTHFYATLSSKGEPCLAVKYDPVLLPRLR